MKILKLPEVESRVGYKSSSIYAMMKSNKFPKNISLGPRSCGWLEDDINKWIQQRIQASRGESA